MLKLQFGNHLTLGVMFTYCFFLTLRCALYLLYYCLSFYLLHCVFYSPSSKD